MQALAAIEAFLDGLSPVAVPEEGLETLTVRHQAIQQNRQQNREQDLAHGVNYKDCTWKAHADDAANDRLD
ncbi:MAG: hypothetical protein AMJ72_13385 [Acidithiobacillales bacterium SM1_46]|nr:MAG: hypothetical protein AMJ72_13385 [Acidithiobacillales bacterium SM1_46]